MYNGAVTEFLQTVVFHSQQNLFVLFSFSTKMFSFHSQQKCFIQLKPFNKTLQVAKLILLLLKFVIVFFLNGWPKCSNFEASKFKTVHVVYLYVQEKLGAVEM